MAGAAIERKALLPRPEQVSIVLGQPGQVDVDPDVHRKTADGEDGGIWPGARPQCSDRQPHRRRLARRELSRHAARPSEHLGSTAEALFERRARDRLDSHARRSAVYDERHENEEEGGGCDGEHRCTKCRADQAAGERVARGLGWISEGIGPAVFAWGSAVERADQMRTQRLTDFSSGQDRRQRGQKLGSSGVAVSVPLTRLAGLYMARNFPAERRGELDGECPAGKKHRELGAVVAGALGEDEHSEAVLQCIAEPAQTRVNGPRLVPKACASSLADSACRRERSSRA